MYLILSLMSKYLPVFVLLFCFSVKAQTKLTFDYDAAGNQTNRTLCITCVLKSAKQVKEVEAIVQDDLLKFSPDDVISYYPNPVKEELYLQWQLANDNYVTSVYVYSITGQVLQTYQTNSGSNNLNIPFQQYSTGVYLVLLSYKDGGEKSIKIIKK
ncbi:putative secreted protein (Por secretion system target) [Flavobacterium sp. 90]|nr:putative secreted protein (Por secretion system target) [Flavobacterium sp. 81]TCK54781.1 putative secreted protein (Por secretion system target) [Flavobacterium sp. 90]